jgi:hypothetical protein
MNTTHPTRDLFNTIQSSFPTSCKILKWEIEEGENMNSLIIDFDKRILLDKNSLDKAVGEISEHFVMKNYNYSVYNSNKLKFFAVIINYEK